MACPKKYHFRKHPRRSYTLTELLAVLLILGLLSAGVVIQLNGFAQRARLEWSVSHLVNLDAALRSHARNHSRPTSIEFELGTGRVNRKYGAMSSELKPESLGTNLSVRRCVTQMRDASVGKATVTFSSVGLSPPYAIEIVTTGKSQQSIWLVFVGATGRPQRVEDEREVNYLVKKVVAQRDDAH